MGGDDANCEARNPAALEAAPSRDQVIVRELLVAHILDVGPLDRTLCRMSPTNRPSQLELDFSTALPGVDDLRHARGELHDQAARATWERPFILRPGSKGRTGHVQRGKALKNPGEALLNELTGAARAELVSFSIATVRPGFGT